MNNYKLLNEEELEAISGGKMTGNGLRNAIVGGAIAGGFSGLPGGPGAAFVGIHVGAAAGAIEYAFNN